MNNKRYIQSLSSSKIFNWTKVRLFSLIQTFVHSNLCPDPPFSHIASYLSYAPPNESIYYFRDIISILLSIRFYSRFQKAKFVVLAFPIIIVI